MKLNPYLSFNGQCKQAFEFYAKCLRGEIVMMLTNGELPAQDQMQGTAPELIMHGRLIIGDQVLMASDAPSNCYNGTKGMTVAINVDTPAEAERIFKELSDGAEITMPMQQTFWAHRFGMLTDRFGIPWMINCEIAAQKAA